MARKININKLVFVAAIVIAWAVTTVLMKPCLITTQTGAELWLFATLAAALALASIAVVVVAVGIFAYGISAGIKSFKEWLYD